VIFWTQLFEVSTRFFRFAKNRIFVSHYVMPRTYSTYGRTYSTYSTYGPTCTYVRYIRYVRPYVRTYGNDGRMYGTYGRTYSTYEVKNVYLVTLVTDYFCMHF